MIKTHLIDIINFIELGYNWETGLTLSAWTPQNFAGFTEYIKQI